MRALCPTSTSDVPRSALLDRGPAAGLFAFEDGVEHAHGADGVLDAPFHRLLAENGAAEGIGLFGILVAGGNDFAAALNFSGEAIARL